MARLIRARSGLDHKSAHALGTGVVDEWARAGLLNHQSDAEDTPGPGAGWVLTPPPTAIALPGAVGVRIGDCRVWLRIDDASLRTELLPLVDCFPREDAGPAAHVLQIAGGAAGWELRLNGHRISAGSTDDDAAITLLAGLLDLACRSQERLLVVHGAGLLAPDDRGLLLVAPGGSGKTTLAAALNASGIGLLSDDVVPVGMDGRLIGLGGPICTKAGSWEVLAATRPDISGCRIFRRFGEPVRMLAPLSRAPSEGLDLGLILFPRYAPGEPPSRMPISPEAALQKVIEAEAVIRDITQDKLDRLTQWVSSAPAFAITYPDLETALLQVGELLEDPRAREGTPHEPS